MKAGIEKKFRKFAAALERIDAEKIYLSSVKETEDLALDLNKVQLLELGIDSAGKPLGVYAKSNKKKQGKINLRDKGTFQDKMFLDVKQIPIVIDSADDKKDIIASKWPKALGLTPEFKDKYAVEVMGVYKQKMHKKIEDLKDKIFS